MLHDWKGIRPVRLQNDVDKWKAKVKVMFVVEFCNRSIQSQLCRSSRRLWSRQITRR